MQVSAHTRAVADRAEADAELSFLLYNQGQTYDPKILIVEHYPYIQGSAEPGVRWGSLSVNPRFSLTSDELTATRMVRAEVRVDGQILNAPWVVTHNPRAFGGSGYARSVKVGMAEPNLMFSMGTPVHGKLTAAMAAGRSVTLTLYDAAGQARTYTLMCRACGTCRARWRVRRALRLDQANHHMPATAIAAPSSAVAR